MTTVYICPSCLVRWKIVPSDDTREAKVYCPNCTPPARTLRAA